MAEKIIFESSKNITNADSNDENEMNDAAPVPTSSKMRNIMHKLQVNWADIEKYVEFLSKEMPDSKIDGNCLFEVERRLDVYLNSNRLKQFENQYTEKLSNKKINKTRADLSSSRALAAEDLQAPLVLEDSLLPENLIKSSPSQYPGSWAPYLSSQWCSKFHKSQMENGADPMVTSSNHVILSAILKITDSSAGVMIWKLDNRGQHNTI
ncbi:hypothetical protein TNCV_3585171 [Trichonephila clavipes]|nr:hypothetical protein TNCV_3585171 [Trichonephila clavipes]